MTVNYIKACKEFNFQLPLKLPVEPPLVRSQNCDITGTAPYLNFDFTKPYLFA